MLRSRRLGGEKSESAPRAHGRQRGQLTRLFQTELFARLGDAGIEGARVPHTHVTAYIKGEGSRLTELAAQARMTRPAMAELVDDLQRLGILERRADPSDGRAKLICLTEAGWGAMRTGQRIIADLEHDYAQMLGVERFEETCQALQMLLDALSRERAAHTRE